MKQKSQRFIIMSKIFEGVLLCSDIDGTMYYNGFVPSNLEALQYFMNEGGLFTFCTGRRAIYAPKEVTPNAPIVGMCGAEVCDASSGTILERWAFGEEWREIAAALHTRTDLAFVQFESEKAHRIPAHDPAVTDFIATFDGPVYKMIFLYKELRQDPELVPPEVRSWCQGRCAVMSNGNDEFEMTAAGRDKANGVRYLKKYTGADLLVCAGDYDGDISMLREADIGYAVDNAAPCVKAAADRVTVHARDGAIAHIIRELEAELRNR